jgi:hypothetical protein
LPPKSRFRQAVAFAAKLAGKRTLRFNQGQPEDEETDDKDVDITVRTTATGTQDTTVRQENTQLDKTNRTYIERLQGSLGRQCQPCMMTLGRKACFRERHMIPLNASKLSILIKNSLEETRLL